MDYYPVMLDIGSRPVLVVGGGSVAERRVEGLLAVGAAVTVLGPRLSEGLRVLADEGRIRHIPWRYRRGDLEGFQLAFVATDDPGVNAAVAAEGRALGVWVNAADDPTHCDFILPAVLRRGPLTVSVATDAVSPALAAAIRDELATVLGEEYGALAELVGEVRRDLRARQLSPDVETWRRALGGDLRGLVAGGGREDARRRLLERLGAA